jgi:DNA polymerase-4
MRIACVYINHFAVQVETRKQPDLSGKPLIIGGFPHERKSVIDCSPVADRCHIHPGVSLRQAHHLCPEAIFLPLNEELYHKAFEEVLSILDGFSPAVEVGCQGKAFMDISGTERLFGPEEKLGKLIGKKISEKTNLQAQIGIAASKFVAVVAALSATPHCPIVVKPGSEKRFLEPLPIELLDVSDEVKEWLRRLGLSSIGQVADLPENALVEQLGLEGQRVHCLACGRDNSPVIPRQKLALLEQEVNFETPDEDRSRLLITGGALLEKLTHQLKNRNQVCGEVRLSLGLEGGNIFLVNLPLKTPTDSTQVILDRIKHHLDTISLPGAVSGLKVGLAQLTGEHGKQSLLNASEKSSRQEELKWLAGRLKARFGQSPLKRIVELAPDSRIPERRVVLAEVKED